VSARYAADKPWALAGEELAWGQRQIRPADPPAKARVSARPGMVVDETGLRLPSPCGRNGLRLGPGTFDPVRGTLLRLGDLCMDGPRLDVWRAPIDNDRGGWGDELRLDQRWREAGLHRMQQRVLGVAAGDESIEVRTRVAAAWQPIGLCATYRWTASPDFLALDLTVTPDGRFDFPLPRLGLRLAVPGNLSMVEWFGLGPGEAYADSCQAARVGRFGRTVDEMQTPYVFPQENGNRMGVRWAELRDPAVAGWGTRGRTGHGLRIAGDGCTFDLTARRWTTEALDAARHLTDLVADDVIHLNLDVGQTGLGSASCGPPTAPRYRLGAGPHTLRLTFEVLPT
jgi:beta-galactosidase